MQDSSLGGLSVKFWGTRGSVPTPGSGTNKYGGNTACVEVRWDGNKRIIFDAGTGIRSLGELLAKDGQPDRCDIILSHLHWDHIQGLPFFIPLFIPDAEIHIWGGEGKGVNLDRMMDHQLHSAFFPVGRSQLSANILFHLVTQEPFDVNGAKLTTARINHPGGGFAYRLETGGKSVVYATDREADSIENHSGELLEPELLELARGADLLIHDAQYSDEEYQRYRRGWGHTSFSDAIRIAREAGVKRLALFHHDPSHTDDFLAREEVRLQCESSDFIVFAAAEGLEILL